MLHVKIALKGPCMHITLHQPSSEDLLCDQLIDSGCKVP